MIQFFNTLTKKKEPFEPLNAGVVTMYNCGPTVYGLAHIGNLRAYIFTDILRRTLILYGFEVKQVMNITDVGHLSSDGDDGEDKMTKALKREGKPMTLEAMKELADRYTETFKADLVKLNIDISNIKFTKATEHISDQIELIKKLESKGLIYSTKDGVYFDVSKIEQYGKLGGLSDIDHSRIHGASEKHTPRDFALWKFDETLGWESPWGKGFPGWHIECSAMSMKYLGETIDIHTGGVDHIPVHHNNEIAQSEGATGKQFVRFWLHNAFLTSRDSKISKSEGNVTYLKDLVDPIAFRYLMLTVHYRSPVEFTEAAFESARTALANLASDLSRFPTGGSVNEDYRVKFSDALNNDLDTPVALSLIWQLLKDHDVSDADKKETILYFDSVFALDLSSRAEKKTATIPDDVKKLVSDREVARQKKDFAQSDILREEIRAKGYEIEDSASGPIVSKK